jgi:hypothetical protein
MCSRSRGTQTPTHGVDPGHSPPQVAAGSRVLDLLARAGRRRIAGLQKVVDPTGRNRYGLVGYRRGRNDDGDNAERPVPCRPVIMERPEPRSVSAARADSKRISAHLVDG